MTSFRRTKIIATIGPASSDRAVLRELLEAGVDVCRLNFSHGSHEEKRNLIDLIRELAREIGKPIGILQDLQGPKIRVGPLATSQVELTRGDAVRVYGDGRVGSDSELAIEFEHLAQEARPGGFIFIDDGLVELVVERVVGDAVEARVEIGGVVRAHQGVNLPGVELRTPCLTKKDEADLAFGLENGVDIVALSFVRRPEDAESVRQIFRSYGAHPPLIAKIEREEALLAIDEVMESFDGVMVARGDLGVNLRREKVPAAQKLIIRKALQAGKPVITATQMLESMTYVNVPTRAEVSDVANAVFEGSDAVMLSGETAIGANPVEAVRTMDRIVREAESQSLPALAGADLAPSNMTAFCAAAVALAGNVEAAAIAALTRSGENALILSALRPGLPIIALCEDPTLISSLTLWNAILPFHVEHSSAIEEASEVIRNEIARKGILPPGSRVIVVGVSPRSTTGRTDFIRMITV